MGNFFFSRSYACLLASLAWLFLVVGAFADGNQIAIAGSDPFGKIEVKSIVKNVINEGGLKEIEFAEYPTIPVDEFPKYNLVIIATNSERPYTGEEALRIKEYVEKGGRLLLIHQGYRAIRESAQGDGENSIAEFESWLGKGRSFYVREGAVCDVLRPADPVLKGVFDENKSPSWLTTQMVLKNEEFENLIGNEDSILVGRKRVGSGTVYYLGHELFRLLLPQYPERHADAPHWARIIQNIILESIPSQDEKQTPRLHNR